MRRRLANALRRLANRHTPSVGDELLRGINEGLRQSVDENTRRYRAWLANLNLAKTSTTTTANDEAVARRTRVDVPGSRQGKATP